jgi:Kef-type K+ transport system membrane component KefB
VPSWETCQGTRTSLQTDFTSFLATVGSAVLTFLAGAEIDPDSLRRHWRASLSIGVVCFASPFAGALLVVTAFMMWWTPALTRLVLRTVGGRVSEPEIKFLFVVLFGLGGLANSAKSEAVLPAYLIGLVVAGVFVRDRIIVDRLRTTAFALLTPFFFLRAGLLISFSAIVSGVLSIAVLFLLKMVTKGLAVWPTAAAFRLDRQDRTYTTLLMATGLTFGSIAALYGLTNNLITQSQYSVLVHVVILSAFVPTRIAQQFFQPDSPTDTVDGTAGEEDLMSLHRRSSSRRVDLDAPRGPHQRRHRCVDRVSVRRVAAGNEGTGCRLR